ncbi:CPBP family intramembrane glutamic endopeptidase [Peptacetobacter sp.]|uniref:CPBP family intramembrane glutamic endopeptidase n=1 Tax=Peptacetobacter sp. TaxID=2991975 RepID=UPI0026349205|nr:type II CAAX endopeptidase family protein [Peptacetobacter sp.]
MNTKYFYKTKEILVISLILLSSVLISSLSTFYILNKHQNIFIRNIIFSLLIILSGKFILKADYKEIKIDLKTIKYNNFDNIYFALIILFLVAILSTFVYQVEFIMMGNRAINIKNILSNTKQISIDNMGLMYIFSLVLVIFIEELFFRFLTFKYIVKDESNKKDIYLFIFVSSILFMLYHGYSVARMVSVFILSISFCLIYIKTKNFILPLIMHILWDFSTFILSPLLTLFEKYNLSLMTAISILNTIFFLILLIIIYIVIKIKSK